MTTSPPVSSTINQVAKTPMPWMNSQNRTPSSPPPPFVQQGRSMISVERDDYVPPLQRTGTAVVANPQHQTQGSNGSGVRVIPITVEGRAAPQPVQQQQTRGVTQNREEIAVQPPWLNCMDKIIPIHLETVPTSAVHHQSRPAPSPVATYSASNPPPTPSNPMATRQQSTIVDQHPPWRTQAAANANQIASMMEE